jgi:hypothetical protein
MNSPCSPEQAAESSARICSDGALSDTSNGTTTASACSPLESLTDLSPQPRSLATCVSSYSPVPLSSTADLLTWLQQAFPVSRSVSQESSERPTTNATCGRQQGTLFAWFDRESLTWRTSQACLLADTQESSSPIWPQWATWDGTGAYQQQTPALRICESDGGLWPTPRANDPEKRGNFANDKRNGLPAAAKYWPTPAASDVKGSVVGSTLEARREMARGVRLPEQVMRMYPTPNTPRPHDSENTAGKFMPSQSQYDLTAAVASDGGQLNPRWVEWLMGWPIGWASLEPLATARFHEWLQQHGSY